jgi:RND superfamily putative drug exporter
MHMMGKANWWLPTWLDRLIPHVNIEVRDAVVAAPPVPLDQV